jgi:hypothetical protein
MLSIGRMRSFDHTSDLLPRTIVRAIYLELPAGEDTLLRFVDSLHVVDLYLACGCLLRTPAAWNRFTARFRDYITRLAAGVTASQDSSLELTDSIIIDLFLPDRSGRSRIGSYGGRSSLATWLRVLVSTARSTSAAAGTSTPAPART